MYKICFYVPESHLEQVKNALFDKGAGKIGNYDSCCWQIAGQGQFRALSGSQPFLGQHGTLEKVEEFRVELVCADELIEEVIASLKYSHPYEEPAYDVVKIESL